MSATSTRGGNVYTNGVRQHYLRFGTRDGPSLLIISGTTSLAVTWAFVAERFAEAGFDTAVVDVRGRGLSESGPDLDYGLDSMAADLRALDLRDVAVVGHSMGARIATPAVAPGMPVPGCLALIDPPVSGPGRHVYPGQLPWYTDSHRAAVRRMDAVSMRQFCPTWTEEQRALRAEWLHTCYEPAIARAHAGLHEDHFRGPRMRGRPPSGAARGKLFRRRYQVRRCRNAG